MAGVERPGGNGHGGSRKRWAGSSRHRLARRRKDWHGRFGLARHRKWRIGYAGHGRLGAKQEAWRGCAGRGDAWQAFDFNNRREK